MLPALIAAGALVRFHALGFGLPYTQARPDETAIIDPVRTLLSGHLPNFFDYPWVLLWIVAGAYLGYFAWGYGMGTFRSVADMLASWSTHYEPFFLIPRAVSATLGTLSIPIVYRLGRQIADETTGLVAALFLALSFAHARCSHFGTTDVAMTFLILWAMTLLLDAHATRQRRGFAAAGLISGLAAATKYNALVLVVPMIVSYVLRILDAPSDQRRRAWRDTSLLVFGAAFVLTFSIGVPFLVIDRMRFMDAMRELLHALHTGDMYAPTSNGWIHPVTMSLRYGLGLPLLVSGLVGAVLLLWREPRKGILFLSFPFAYYVVAGSVRLLFFRYTMPIIPFLSVTSAYLVTTLVPKLLGRMDAWRFRYARPLAIAGVSLAIVWTSAGRTWAFDRVLKRVDSRVVLARWFAEHVPPGSTVAQSGSQYGRARFAGDLGYKEWKWDGSRMVFLLEGRRLSMADAPDWIVIQDSPLPSSTQDILRTLVDTEYELTSNVRAFSPSSDLVYDQSDMFFVPYSGFKNVVRPGPNFSVFRRKHALANNTQPRACAH
jgi:hypothetical protein